MSPEEMYTDNELKLFRMREEAMSRASSGQLQRSAPAEFMPTTGVDVPVNESTPAPPAPNMERLAKNTAASQAEIRDQAPPLMTNDQQAMAAGAGGLALLGWLASKFMGGDDNNPPNDNKGPKSRDIRREPQMDMTVKGPQEPTFVAEPVVQQAPTVEPVAKPAAPIPELPQATISGQQQPQMQYGQTTLNAPTGTPNPLPAGPVAPPAEVAPVAVQPKPIDPVVQARIDSIAAADRRKEALHQLELEEKRLRIESAKQKSQGQPVSQYSNDEKQMNQRSQEAKVNKEIIAANNKPKTTPAANVEKSLVVASQQPPAAPANTFPAPAPVANAAPAPVVASTTAPVVPSAEKVAEAEKLTKEQKGMKNYLVAQYGGGPDGEGAYRKVIDILGEVPAFEKGQGGGLSKEANNTIKEWRKSNIEGPKVNLTHDMKKVMKGAGGAAVLMALPGFAEAAQRKDMGKMSDIFTDFFVLPFAQSREAGMPKAQEEDIIASKFKEASKLGSPYRSVPPPKR